MSKLGQAINILVFGGAQPRDIAADVREFKDKKRRGNIDIWCVVCCTDGLYTADYRWLHDDGGMPVLLSHILQSRQQVKHVQTTRTEDPD